MTLLKKLSKFYLWIMSALIGLLMMSWAMDREMNEDLPEEDKQIYRFMNLEGQKMEQKYHMDLVGIGVGGRVAVGLPVPSIIRFKLFTLDHRLIFGRLGKLSETDRHRVREKLKEILVLRTVFEHTCLF